jgi:hypothetical protein
LDRDELAAYLQTLRAEPAGRHEGMQSDDADRDASNYPPPAGEVEVVERASGERDRATRAITLRWRASDASASRRSGVDG